MDPLTRRSLGPGRVGGVKTLKTALTLLPLLGALLGGAALGGGAASPKTAAPPRAAAKAWGPQLKPAFTHYTYACAGGEQVQVYYVTSGEEFRGLPVFAVLAYRGQSYGLAPAVSGSGARYVGHVGLNTAGGLEWWEHQGEATLSTFAGDDASKTRPLLRCTLRL